MKSKERVACVCPTCGRKHFNEKREIALYKGMLTSLVRIYKWLKEKDRDTFKRHEINHLFNTGNEFSRFGDWKHFGGLAEKSDGGTWKLNMERCRLFFSGQTVIPTKVLKDPISGKIVDKYDYRNASEIPDLYKFLDENQLYVPKYEPGSLFGPRKRSDDDVLEI